MATAPVTTTGKDKTLRTWARYDGRGVLIPGTLIKRRTQPKNGNWVEIASTLCCVPTTTMTPT